MKVTQTSEEGPPRENERMKQKKLKLRQGPHERMKRRKIKMKAQ